MGQLYIVEMSAAARGLRRYVCMVADELGIRPAFCVDVDDTASIYLALDRRLRRFPERDLALLWDEKHGWSVGVESGCGEDIIVLAYLGDELLPPAAKVARFVNDVFLDRYPGEPAPPILRTPGTADSLDDQLSALGLRG